MLKLDLLNSSKDDKTNKKKQKLVKHKRKNWSKTDISEVERGIDELRKEQLTGGVVAEKKDSELFFINKTKIKLEQDEDTKNEHISFKKHKPTLEEKMQNLNCYRNLLPNPHSAPIHHINPKLKPDISSKRQQKLSVLKSRKAKLVLKKKKIIEADNENEIKPIDKKLDCTLETDFKRDLWNSSELPEDINDTNEYYYRGKNMISIKRPKNKLYTKSAIAKIELPHPGTSYNPDYDEHQDLLMKAHLIELNKLKKEQKEMRKLTTCVKKMTWNQIEQLWLKEMSIDNLLDQHDKKELGQEIEDVNQAVNENDKKESSKKSKKGETKAKKHRKMLLEKIKKRQKENEKKMKQQQNEIYRLKSIKKEISEKEKEQEDKKLLRELEEKHRELFSTKRLGRIKFEEPEIDLKLSDEITGNLRTLKPEGNILTDRYKSLQKRNIIEPRERAKRQKPKYSKKKFDKRNAYEKTYYIK